MAKAVHLNPDRDPRILYFLWKWKFAPSIVIFERFFKNSKFDTAYHRLRKLEKAGYVQSCLLDKTFGGNVWMLGPLGYRTVKRILAPLSEDGFKSENMIHDLLVNAVHCGDFGEDSKSRIYFTEQELRRYALGEYPEGVPKTDLHRPDGYWVFRDGNDTRTIALEVELNPKEDFRYGMAGRFYEMCNEVSRIIWVVKTDTLGKKIMKSLMDGIEGDTFCHSFVDLGEFLRHGFQAKVSLGHSVGSSLNCLTHQWDVNQVVKASPGLVTHRWLDVRKIPFKTDICNRVNILHF